MSNAPSSQAESARGPQTVFWVAWTVVLGAKFLLAAQLAPFGDEAWYWQESRHLAWGYGDLPPATAALIAFGEAAFGHGTLGMRLPFLALGALLPLVVVPLTRRLFGAVDGWHAGLLTLMMPLIGTLGIFALPDVPLTLASVLALDAFERAAATRRLRYWAMLGVALGVAWLCHYRAAMLMASGLVFLCVTPRGRHLWREPGLWLALGLAFAGLLPTLVFNATHAWIALGFQLVERNPWAFHGDALVQPIEQALVCTPLFYGLLLWAAWRCLRRARQAPFDLLSVCALVPIVGYFVLGCFADDTRFRVHWPIPGYLPLLLVMPGLLREFAAPAHRVLRMAALGVLVLGSGAAFAYLTIAAVPGGASMLAGIKAFPEHMVGWPEAAAKTRELLATRDATLLVADNFMLAAELDFALDARQPIYVLDHPINAKHGRAAQLALWQRDENALKSSGLRKVLLVAEPSARRERERAGWMRSLCARIAGLSAVDALDLYEGRKRFRWFNGFSGTDATVEECAVAAD